MKFLRRLLALLLLAAAGAGGWFAYQYSLFTDSPLAIRADEAPLDVARGTAFVHIVAELQRRELSAAHRWYWRALAWQMGVGAGLHAGEYALEPGTTPRALLAKMARGEVIQRRFTIVEGWTFRELRAALARAPALEITLAGASEADIMARLDLAGVAAEGRFLPETYLYARGTSDLELLRRANAALNQALAQAWAARDPELAPGSIEQALILASIVEKETGQASERARIAGVFARRLKLGMLLQTDPTVIYGLGAGFDGNLTRKHLETDTPYNTYTRPGLPPTPIALPGKEAIEAALKPAPGKELYFVARGDGSHEFTASLAEHNAAVARWQLRRR